MIARTIVFAASLMATQAWAQSGFPALLAERPAADSRAKLSLFGQFVGDWLYEGVEYHADGSRVTDKGEIHFHWVLQGRAIQDVWLETERSDASPKIYGTTLRFYDAKTDSWRNTWIEPTLGVTSMLTGKQVGDEIVLAGQASDGAPIRWIFSEIKPNSFHWHGEKLSGKEWRTYEYLKVRRKSQE